MNPWHLRSGIRFLSEFLIRDTADLCCMLARYLGGDRVLNCIDLGGRGHVVWSALIVTAYASESRVAGIDVRKVTER
jgi:hypothetical protein